MAKDPEWITRERQTITNFLGVLNALDALAQQYIALDYGNSLTPEDFAPPNDDIDLPQLVAAIASVQAIGEFVAAGHATNLYKLVV